MTSVLDGVRAWVFDVDGCLVRTARPGGAGGTAIPGAAELLAELRAAGHTVLVCTNASQESPATCAAHLRATGIDVDDKDFVTAGSAAADHIATHHRGARVLALGGPGLTEPLRALGLTVVDPAGGHDPGAGLADVVVVGATDSYTTAALNAAALAVDAGAPLYTTVDVPWFHGGLRKAITVSAAIAHAIGWTTGTHPQVLGKPSPGLAGALRRRLGDPGGRTAVVGDALVEVQLARRMDAHAVLVRSGHTSHETLSALPPDERPDVTLADVGELYALVLPHLRQQQGVPQ